MTDYFFQIAARQVDRTDLDAAETHSIHALVSEQLAFNTWNLMMAHTYGYDTSIRANERAVKRWLELANRWNRHEDRPEIDTADALDALATEIPHQQAMQNRRSYLITSNDLH